MNNIEVRIERLEPMRVARFHAISRSPEAEAWARLRQWAEPRGFLKDPARHPVFGFNNPSPSPGCETYGYESWIRLDSADPVEEGTGIVEFPGGWYAVATHRGFPNPAVWMQLLERVRRSPHHHRLTHELEHPHNPLAPESAMVFDLYLPIEEPVASMKRET